MSEIDSTCCACGDCFAGSKLDGALCVDCVDAKNITITVAQAHIDALHAAIRRMHACKGRYHMQLATCDLYDLLDLPNVRPTK